MVKYRAWDKESKKMIDVEVINFRDKQVGIYDDLSEKWDYYNFQDIVLMEFTEQKDQSSVPQYIAEGDILKFNDTWAEYDFDGYVDGETTGINYVEIEKTADGWGFGKTKAPETCIDYMIEEERLTFSEIIKNESFNMVVVGNIYENPELLD